MCYVFVFGFDFFNNYFLELLLYRIDRVEVLVYYIINNFVILYSVWSIYFLNLEEKKYDIVYFYVIFCI